MIDREALIAAGWTPPLGDPQYEAWRPALTLYQQLMGGPAPEINGLDRIDRENIDILRAVARVMPPLASGE